MAGEIVPPSDRQRLVTQPPVVRLRHIGKPRAKPSSLTPTSGLRLSRLIWSSMTMMSPHAKFGFSPPAAFETIKQFDPEGIHHAHRKCGPLGRVALVAMKPPLHGDDGDAVQLPAQQPPAMPHRRRLQKVGHVAVVDRLIKSDRLANRPQPRPQNNPAPRPPRPTGPDEFGGFGDLVVKLKHEFFTTEDTEVTEKANREIVFE